MSDSLVEERFRTLVEHGLDAVALIEPNGTVSFVSRPITRVLGYTPEEFMNFNPFELVHPDERPTAQSLFANLVVQPGGSQTTVNRVRHKDGSWRWIEVVSTNHLAGPSVRAVVANFRDVTDRKRDEEAIREAQEKFRLIIESATQFAIFTTDLAGLVNSWNTGATRILGYEEAEIIGQDCRIFFTPEDNIADKPECEMQSALAKGRGSDERWHVRKSGQRFWASGLMMPLRDDDGTVRGYLKILRDMTREKRAEEAVRESEARFRSMADSSPIMIWITDTEGRHIYFNKPWLNFTGRSRDEDLAEAWIESVHAEDRDCCAETFRNAFESHDPFDLEYRLRRLDGEYRWILVRANALFSHDGDFTGYIGSGIDITDRKQAEESLKEADRRKDEFLAMLAHELRNPLAAIKNAVQLSLQPAEGENHEWSKQVIERQAKHLGRLLDDLLDVSRITQGKFQLKKEPIDLSSIIERAVETVRPGIARKQQKLHIAVPQVPMPVFADPARMEQLFVNLLENATKFTATGGRISLSAQRDREVTVSVVDNGVGIPQEMLARVFEPFAQVDATIDRSQGGLGIGLALARSLIEMHGGSIRAVSDGPGYGSEFVVSVPLSDASQTPGKNEQGPKASTITGVRILVVDDNQDTATGMAKLLIRLGYEVNTAYDGPSAIELARAESPEFILMDIGLPGRDGYEVARQLRTEDCGKHVIMIAISGYGQPDDLRRSAEAGFDHHLVKPIDFDSLSAILAPGRS